jgi:hypothetical protein
MRGQDLRIGDRVLVVNSEQMATCWQTIVIRISGDFAYAKHNPTSFVTPIRSTDYVEIEARS